MDNAVSEKFCGNFGLSDAQIKTYEDMYNKDILPVISRHYLSHLVTTIEELINEKKKQAFLEHIRNSVVKNTEYVYTTLERAVKQKMLRLFSIILCRLTAVKF